MNLAQHRKIKVDKRVDFHEPDIAMEDDEDDSPYERRVKQPTVMSYSTIPLGGSKASTWLAPNTYQRNSSIEQPCKAQEKAVVSCIKDFKINQPTTAYTKETDDDGAIWTNTDMSLTYSDIKTPQESDCKFANIEDVQRPKK